MDPAEVVGGEDVKPKSENGVGASAGLPNTTAAPAPGRSAEFVHEDEDNDDDDDDEDDEY